jgi:hypothetical protein
MTVILMAMILYKGYKYSPFGFHVLLQKYQLPHFCDLFPPILFPENNAKEHFLNTFLGSFSVFKKRSDVVFEAMKVGELIAKSHNLFAVVLIWLNLSPR